MLCVLVTRRAGHRRDTDVPLGCLASSSAGPGAVAKATPHAVRPVAAFAGGVEDALHLARWQATADALRHPQLRGDKPNRPRQLQ